MNYLKLIFPFLFFNLFLGERNINDKSNLNSNNEKGDIFYVTNGGYFKEEESYFFYKNKKTNLPTKKDIYKNGFEFDGWYDNKYLLGDKIEFVLSDSESVKLYAKWNVADIMIDFVLDGGTIEEDFSYDLTSSNEVIKLPTEVYKESYSFVGWYDNDNFFGDQITHISNLKKSIILYAKYEPRIEYSEALYVMINGGELKEGVHTKLFVGVSTPLASNDAFIYYGYHLDGYGLNQRYSTGIYYNYIADRGNIYYPFFPRFLPNRHNIYYLLEDGETINESLYRTYFEFGETFALPTANKYLYNFLGWMIDKAEENIITTFEGNMDNDVYLYPKFELKPIKPLGK